MECFGRDPPFYEVCSDCVNEFKARQHPYSEMATAVSAMVHIFHYQEKNVTKTLDDLNKMFQRTEKLVYASMPSYRMSKVPIKYKSATIGREQVYWDHLKQLDTLGVRYLDFFQLTSTCIADNCTYDGGHRSRYVNRWKAQLLLNTLCEFSY
mmetsp:Transcript_10113/g.16925  ORF Transcript_10113/g.16925 Transcript_10113/m.16925 type:complete len:152 (-) Transcript_10113:1220-1675(-)